MLLLMFNMDVIHKTSFNLEFQQTICDSKFRPDVLTEIIRRDGGEVGHVLPISVYRGPSRLLCRGRCNLVHPSSRNVPLLGDGP